MPWCFFAFLDCEFRAPHFLHPHRSPFGLWMTYTKGRMNHSYFRRPVTRHPFWKGHRRLRGWFCIGRQRSSSRLSLNIKIIYWRDNNKSKKGWKNIKKSLRVYMLQLPALDKKLEVQINETTSYLMHPLNWVIFCHIFE